MNFKEHGIPEGYTKFTILGTVGGELYVNPQFVTERTTKGFVSQQELANAFEGAERFFSENPTENEYMYDSFKFHTYQGQGFVIYCLPFGCVFYSELDHA